MLKGTVDQTDASPVPKIQAIVDDWFDSSVTRYWRAQLLPDGCFRVPDASILTAAQALSFLDEWKDKKEWSDSEITVVRQLTSCVWPTREALDVARAFIEKDKVVSVGSDAAYWEFLLQHAGVRIIATDAGDLRLSYTVVEKLEADVAVEKYNNCCNVLFIGWPTIDGYDAKALQAFKGDKMILLASVERDETNTVDEKFAPEDHVGSTELWRIVRASWTGVKHAALPFDDPLRQVKGRLACYKRVDACRAPGAHFEGADEVRRQ